MKKVKIFVPHMELRIHVSDEMVRDYRECKELASVPGEDGRDCSTCSWRDAKIEDVSACDLVKPEQVLE